MLDSLASKIAGYLAARITEEVIRQLPEIIDSAIAAAVKSLPDAYEGLADQIIDRITDRLPFPFLKK